jgi:hypothetical protein
LELKQECIAELEAREKETAGEEEEPQRKFTEKGLAEAFADLNKQKKKSENMGPQNRKIFINREECSWYIICLQVNL